MHKTAPRRRVTPPQMSTVLRLRNPVLKKRRPWGSGEGAGHCPQIPEEPSQHRRALVLSDCKGPGKMVRGNPLGDSFYQSVLSNQETGCLGGGRPSISTVMQAGGHARNGFLPWVRGWMGDPEILFPPAGSLGVPALKDAYLQW